MQRYAPTALAALAALAEVLAATSAHGSEPVDPDWWSAARAEIERSEYRVSQTSDGLQAPNRAKNLRTFFRDGAIEVVPRTNAREHTPWRFGWRTEVWGRAGRMVDLRQGPPTIDGCRVTYPSRDISEWYENREVGLEQGFTVRTRASGEGPLRIAGRVDGGLCAELRPDGTVDFTDDNDVRVLNYGELHAWDADGAELVAWLEVEENRVAIAVDDRTARYPVTIDPILTTVDWTALGGQAGAFFGERLATAGDVNGDGYSDVIVGARYDNGEVDEGRAYVYYGSASGLSASPSWTYENDEEGSLLGHGVASAGDVNGDGYDDVIVGASRVGDNRGRVYLFHGSAAGLDASPDWVQDGPQNFSLFGWSLAGAGDVNGDGYADVIVGALQYDVTGGENEGRAVVYHGSPTGLDETPSWTVDGDDFRGQFGTSVSTAGDVNGDGYDDVIVGAYVSDNGETDEGRAFVYHGGPAGLSTSADWSREGNEDNAWFGFSVSTAGDVDGDGYADVLVGAPHKNGGGIVDSGEAYLYYGGSTGLSTTPAWTGGTSRVGAEYGWSVATAGDLNGDGFADAIIGMPKWYSSFDSVEGAVVFMFGSASSSVWLGGGFTFGVQDGARFGHCVATAGDVNGDGLSDILVGTQRYTLTYVNEGQALLYLGETEALSASADWTDQGSSDFAYYGYSVSTAGDVNGDGFSDVVVGAPTYDGGETNEGRVFVYHGSSGSFDHTQAWTFASDQAGAALGISVASAGDVNGDGFGDVIVGAYRYTQTLASEGAALVFLGSDVGLEESADWIVGGGQEGSYQGWSVASAGDVNGDGYADVIVGAPYFEDSEAQEGRATTYLGSESGLATSPEWSVVSGQSAAFLGVSVASAGDVNGDGYSDVVVGAPFFENGQADEGIAQVYHGSSAGLSVEPSWTGELDIPLAQFGYSVATAGDINGDGFSDVLVGAPLANSMTSSAGAAVALLGSEDGLGEIGWSVVFDQDDALYGWSVSTAGDVNGDGYSDFVVGAPGERAAFLYVGAAEILSTTPASVLTSATLALRFGWSVASAGDVNGDGFSDVIVGGLEFDGGARSDVTGGGDPGAAFLYYGNARRGREYEPRQRRVEGDAPIALLGRSDRQDGFGVELRARTAAGRSQLRLELEVKPAELPFDGAGTVVTSPSDGGLGFSWLTHVVTGLSEDSAYRWRARVLDDSPLFPHSRWMSAPGNGITEYDLRTALAIALVGEGDPHAVVALGVPLPNPFSGGTALPFALSEPAVVRLAIYDVAGRRVALVAEDRYPAGDHTLRWDGRSASGGRVAAGTYFAQLTVGGQSRIRKVVFVR
jgi:hypothetical protein